MIRIAGLQDMIARLARLDVPAAKARGTQAAARLLHDTVTADLSHPPGATPQLPALRSGALRASIARSSDSDGAVVASTSPVAVFQELGTARMAPRPFLGSAATQHAAAVAEAIADALRTETAP